MGVSPAIAQRRLRLLYWVVHILRGARRPGLFPIRMGSHAELDTEGSSSSIAASEPIICIHICIYI